MSKDYKAEFKDIQDVVEGCTNEIDALRKEYADHMDEDNSQLILSRLDTRIFIDLPTQASAQSEIKYAETYSSELRAELGPEPPDPAVQGLMQEVRTSLELLKDLVKESKKLVKADLKIATIDEEYDKGYLESFKSDDLKTQHPTERYASDIATQIKTFAGPYSFNMADWQSDRTRRELLSAPVLKIPVKGVGSREADRKEIYTALSKIQFDDNSKSNGNHPYREFFVNFLLGKGDPPRRRSADHVTIGDDGTEQKGLYATQRRFYIFFKHRLRLNQEDGHLYFLDVLPHPEMQDVDQSEDRVYMLRVIHGKRDLDITIDKFRNDPVGGSYRGATAMWGRLRFYYTNLPKSQVTITVAASDQNALMASKPRPKITNPLTTYAPMQHWEIDLMQVHGGTSISAEKKDHVVVCVDHFTKLVLMDVLSGKKPEQVVDVVEYWFSIFGPPMLLTSDQGGEFEGVAFREMCTNWDVVHRKGTSHHPQSQGLVENVNRRLRRAMKADFLKTGMINKGNIRWYCYSINSLPSQSTGFPPLLLHMGRAPRWMPKNSSQFALGLRAMFNTARRELLTTKGVNPADETWDNFTLTDMKAAYMDSTLLQDMFEKAGEPGEPAHAPVGLREAWGEALVNNGLIGREEWKAANATDDVAERPALTPLRALRFDSPAYKKLPPYIATTTASNYLLSCCSILTEEVVPFATVPGAVVGVAIMLREVDDMESCGANASGGMRVWYIVLTVDTKLWAIDIKKISEETAEDRCYLNPRQIMQLSQFFLHPRIVFAGFQIRTVLSRIRQDLKLLNKRELEAATGAQYDPPSVIDIPTLAKSMVGKVIGLQPQLSPYNETDLVAMILGKKLWEHPEAEVEVRSLVREADEDGYPTQPVHPILTARVIQDVWRKLKTLSLEIFADSGREDMIKEIAELAKKDELERREARKRPEDAIYERIEDDDAMIPVAAPVKKGKFTTEPLDGGPVTRSKVTPAVST